MAEVNLLASEQNEPFPTMPISIRLASAHLIWEFDYAIAIQQITNDNIHLIWVYRAAVILYRFDQIPWFLTAFLWNRNSDF